MGAEVELKLLLPLKSHAQARRLPWFREQAGKPAYREVTSVYFDTKKRKLRGHDLTLRVRKTGRQYVQTIKSASSPRGGDTLGRGEWEHPIASAKPDLSLAKNTPLAKLASPKLKRTLRPVFKTQVLRTTANVRSHGSRIELVLDRGKITAARRAEPISELELELKRGRSADLAALARKLQRTLPLSFGARTKSERGFALLSGESQQPVAVTPIALDRSQGSGAAFARIGLSCLHHIASNKDAVIAGHSEGIHQMRVGLRRLRAAISLFGEMLVGRRTEQVKAELRWLTEQLGPARDLDVLLKEAVAPLTQNNPEQPELDVLEKTVKQERRTEFARARDAIQDERYRKLLLDTVLWLIEGEWGRSTTARALRDQRIDKAAAAILDRRAIKIIKGARRLGELDTRKRHKLRIAVKKLRYGCDFFASLFGHPKAQKQFGKALKTLQGSLGRINDFDVHSRRAHRLTHDRRPSRRRSQEAYAMGFLTGREKRKVRTLERDASRAARKLAALKRFW